MSGEVIKLNIKDKPSELVFVRLGGLFVYILTYYASVKLPSNKIVLDKIRL